VPARDGFDTVGIVAMDDLNIVREIDLVEQATLSAKALTDGAGYPVQEVIRVGGKAKDLGNCFNELRA
jgi:hypothetical protein